jgi:hypothetical protein
MLFIHPMAIDSGGQAVERGGERRLVDARAEGQRPAFGGWVLVAQAPSGDPGTAPSGAGSSGSAGSDSTGVPSGAAPSDQKQRVTSGPVYGQPQVTPGSDSTGAPSGAAPSDQRQPVTSDPVYGMPEINIPVCTGPATTESGHESYWTR